MSEGRVGLEVWHKSKVVNLLSHPVKMLERYHLLPGGWKMDEWMAGHYINPQYNLSKLGGLLY